MFSNLEPIFIQENNDLKQLTVKLAIAILRESLKQAKIDSSHLTLVHEILSSLNKIPAVEIKSWNLTLIEQLISEFNRVFDESVWNSLLSFLNGVICVEGEESKEGEERLKAFIRIIKLISGDYLSLLPES